MSYHNTLSVLKHNRSKIKIQRPNNIQHVCCLFIALICSFSFLLYVSDKRNCVSYFSKGRCFFVLIFYFKKHRVPISDKEKKSSCKNCWEVQKHVHVNVREVIHTKIKDKLYASNHLFCRVVCGYCYPCFYEIFLNDFWKYQNFILMKIAVHTNFFSTKYEPS